MEFLQIAAVWLIRPARRHGAVRSLGHRPVVLPLWPVGGRVVTAAVGLYTASASKEAPCTYDACAITSAEGTSWRPRRNTTSATTAAQRRTVLEMVTWLRLTAPNGIGVVLSADLPFLVSGVEQTSHARMITPLPFADTLRLRRISTVVGPLVVCAAYYKTDYRYGSVE